MEDGIRRTDPTRLASMLESQPGDRPWKADELADVLRHQLAAPAEFGENAVDDACSTPALDASSPERGWCINELLLQPNPPINLLTQLKNFAKGQALDPGHVLPQDIAIVLYYAAICSARLHCQQRITELDDRSLATGLSQLMSCTWLDPAIRSMFTESLNGFLANHSAGAVMGA